jgi:NTE family protein
VQPGQELDFTALKDDVDKIYGLGLFERIDTRLVEKDDKTGLNIKTVRKSWGPTYLNFGMELESDLDGGSSFNVSTRITATEINRWGAEWRSDIQVGERPRLLTEFYQPVGTYSSYFIAPRLELEEFTAHLFVDDTAVTNYRVARRAVALDVGRAFGTWGELRLGYIREKADADAKIGALTTELLEEELALPFGLDNLGDQKFDTGALMARFSYDTYDSVNFPHRGARGDIELFLAREELGSDDSFDSVSGRLSKAFTRGWNTLILYGGGGTVFDGRAAIQNTFALGGLFNISGLARDQLRGQHALMGALAAYRQIAGKGSAPPNLPIYLGFSLEAGNVWKDEKDITLKSLIPAGSAWLGMDTPLGPVYVAYGVAEGGRNAFYFYLGRGF